MNDFDKYLLRPKYTVLESRESVDLSVKLLPNLTLKVPIVASPMNTVCEHDMAVTIARAGGVGVIHRYMTSGEQADMVRKVKEQGVSVGAAIASGSREKQEFRTSKLLKAGADFLLGDIANGDSGRFLSYLKYVRKQHGDDVAIVSPNIVTAEAAKRYATLGIQGFRVGVGNGSVCTTRSVAGVGRNQITSIKEIHSEFPEIPVWSCGGIRQASDITKALAAGASAVIVGRLLAPCIESPAPRLSDGKVRYFGMGSYFAEELRIQRTKEPKESIYHMKAPEGKEDVLEPNGTVADLIKRISMELRIGFAYLGAENLAVLWKNAEWESQDGSDNAEFWGWVGGIIDGEGTLTVTSSKDHPSALVQVSNTERELLEPLLALGGRIYELDREGNRKRQYKWVANDTWNTIRAIQPHLRSERKQEIAKLLLEIHSSRTSLKNTPKRLALIDDHVKRIHRLNKTGKGTI